MPITFSCPHCGLQTNVADDFAGRSGPCARCGKTVTIPFPGATAAPKSSGSGWTIVIVIVAVLGVAVVCGGILLALLLPAVQAAREAARRSQCSNNLKQIGLGLHNYHDTYKTFPTAVLTDKSGKPMRSWRVAILPFIEQRPLYDRYDSNQPWDSPKNVALGQIPLTAYRCPSDNNLKPTETNYVMVVGENTIGGKPNEEVSFADIPDGSSNTIAVVEITGLGINWNEPRDITVDELMKLVAVRCVSQHPGGFQVLLADGSVRFLDYSIDPQTLRDLLIRNDRKRVNF